VKTVLEALEEDEVEIWSSQILNHCQMIVLRTRSIRGSEHGSENEAW